MTNGLEDGFSLVFRKELKWLLVEPLFAGIEAGFFSFWRSPSFLLTLPLRFADIVAGEVKTSGSSQFSELSKVAGFLISRLGLLLVESCKRLTWVKRSDSLAVTSVVYLNSAPTFIFYAAFYLRLFFVASLSMMFSFTIPFLSDFLLSTSSFSISCRTLLYYGGILLDPTFFYLFWRLCIKVAFFSFVNKFSTKTY